MIPTLPHNYSTHILNRFQTWSNINYTYAPIPNTGCCRHIWWLWQAAVAAARVPRAPVRRCCAAESVVASGVLGKEHPDVVGLPKGGDR